MCDASWLSDEQLRLLVAAERLTVLANADRAALEQALSASRNRSSAEGTDDQQRMWYLRALAAATPESRDGALVAHGGLLYLLGGFCTNRPYNRLCPRRSVFEASTEAYVLDVSAARNKWRPVPRMTFSDRRHLPRPGIIACSHGEGIYMYGGYRSDGFVSEMSFLNLASGSCHGLEIGVESSPMEDGTASRMTGVIFENKWIVARRLVMLATLYKFDFKRQIWSMEEHQVEGREDGLMCIHELAVHNGQLYALNEDLLPDNSGSRLEIRRLEDHRWRRLGPAPPSWLQTVRVMETYYAGAVLGNHWVIWGSRAKNGQEVQESRDLTSPSSVLTVEDLEAYYMSDWGASYEVFPLAFDFRTATWETLFDEEGSCTILGQEPITRKLHSLALAPDGRSIIVAGGEMVPVPGTSGVPIPCHVTEQLTLIPASFKGLGNPSGLAKPADILEEMYSLAGQVLADSLCDVQVYARGSPDDAACFSSCAMCQRSEVFRQMLTGSMLESSTRRIELPPVSRASIQALRHLCHLELEALEECCNDMLTLVELFSLCCTYMVQPLGLRVVEDMIEARLVGDSERGFTHTVRFWNALHETNVTEVFHQGLPELAAIHMSADYPNRVVRFQQSEAFRHLAADRAASLLDYVEQTALRRQVDAVRLEI